VNFLSWHKSYLDDINVHLLYIYLFDFSGERNFHIFYYIHDGLRQDDKLGKYHLNSQSAYQYLSGHNAQYFDSTTTSTNRSKFKTIQRCFETIGFKTQVIW